MEWKGGKDERKKMEWGIFEVPDVFSPTQVKVERLKLKIKPRESVKWNGNGGKKGAIERREREGNGEGRNRGGVQGQDNLFIWLNLYTVSITAPAIPAFFVTESTYCTLLWNKVG